MLPTIFSVWDRHQQAFFSQQAAEDHPLVLGGDGRAGTVQNMEVIL
jgi:hypothetical protein